MFPDLVRKAKFTTKFTPDGTYQINYNVLIAPMIKAIQELKAQNDDLRVDLVKARNDDAAEIRELRADIEKLKANQH